MRKGKRGRRKPERRAKTRIEEKLTPEQAELAKVQKERAPMTTGGHESLRGFRVPRTRWDTAKRGVCRRCEGSGTYVADGLLRVCRCSAA